MEECARGTGQMSNYAAVTGAQIKLRMEECASGMGPMSNYAAVTGAQIKYSGEECARDMGLIAIRMTNQLCLDLLMRKLLQLCLFTISILLEEP
jgi:hypothetical protein